MVTEYIAFESWCFNSAVVMNCVVPVKMSNMSNSTTNRVKCRLKQGPCRHSDQESHDTMNISSTYDLGQFDMSAGATMFHAPSAPFPLCSPRGSGPFHSGKCIIILRTCFDDLDGSGPLVAWSALAGVQQTTNHCTVPFWGWAPMAPHLWWNNCSFLSGVPGTAPAAPHVHLFCPLSGETPIIRNNPDRWAPQS
eukprot:gene22986-biopygen13338